MQKILIVEDDSDIQELLENHLIGAGYSVVSANDGVEALSHFSQQAINMKKCVNFSCFCDKNIVL